MRTREVESQAYNLIDWELAAKELAHALDYAKGKEDILESEGYLDSDNGIVVSLDWDNNVIASEFLGTVFALTPSGKYYPPWANSNVDPCPRCKGTGLQSGNDTCVWCQGMGSREAYLDQVWNDTAQDRAGEFGLFLISGEGDPCDIFVGMARELPID